MLVPVQGNPIVYRLNCPGSGCQSVISEWMAILGNLYLRTRWASGLFSIKIVGKDSGGGIDKSDNGGGISQVWKKTCPQNQTEKP